MTLEEVDVLIIGAGIVGAACAADCAREGLRVVVAEKGPIGGGTTSTGMGQVLVLDDSEAEFELTRYSQQLWHQLLPRLPPEARLRSAGTLWLANDEVEFAQLELKHVNFESHGVPARLLDTEGVERAEPNLRRNLAGGLLVSNDLIVDPPVVTRFLIEEAQVRKAKVLLGATVEELVPSGARLSDGQILRSRRVVVACGVDSPRLVPSVPIRPRKGHLVLMNTPPEFVTHSLAEVGYSASAHGKAPESVAFNVLPRGPEHLLVGSSRQWDVGGADVDSRIIEQIMDRAATYLPEIRRSHAVRSWTGLRPATPDGLPLIGPLPEAPCVLLATGHEGLGITASLATGRLIADLLVDRRSEIAREPFLPKGRLAGPEPGGPEKGRIGEATVDSIREQP